MDNGRLDIECILRLAPVIPVLVIEHVADAVPIARALVNGGLRVLEVTLRTPDALRVIARLAEAVPQAVVGAGTIRDAAQMQAAAQAGASFAVSPGISAALVDAAAAAAMALLPGVMTPSEVMAARAHGLRCLKFFPAREAGGVAMLEALHGPFPDLLFCPTGGIDGDSAASYLALPNVLCVGGSWVVPAQAVARQDWLQIESNARAAVHRAARTRGWSPPGE